MAEEQKSVKNIQSVHRALDLLEAVCERGYGYKLGDLAARCGLNKTTAFHLLKTLEARGYIEQSYDTQMYKLGWKSFDLFADAYEKIDSTTIALPYMEKIHDIVDETVSFYYFHFPRCLTSLFFFEQLLSYSISLKKTVAIATKM